VTEGKDGHYLLKIADTGNGISEKDLNKIFNPFFSTKDRGTGLGLSIVRNIIEGHNGKIWIENRTAASGGEGPAGTQVMIRIPLA
jgi:signal transduction histidine kinase